MNITDLKVNNLTAPLGVDTDPTFRWINHMDGYGKAQSAYQIIVASTAGKAAAHTGDIWDSGKVPGTANYDISYAGKALTSRTPYYWTVQVWDESGTSIGWSEVATFETGILDDSEWKAKWIGAEDGDRVANDMTLAGANWIWWKNGVSSAASGTESFRGHFTVNPEKTVDKVLLATSMDDYGNIYINRHTAVIVRKATNAWKNGVVEDITAYVNPGDNLIAARVTNTGSSAGFIAKIQVRYTDGSVDTAVTNRGWKCSASANSSSGWERMGYNDTGWSFPDQVVAYGGGAWGTDVVMPNTVLVNKGMSAPMLRKTFSVNKDIARARVYISGLGLYELRINGTPPDDTVLSPAHTQYEDTVHYRAYDVTELLSVGKNAVAVELGNFFYTCDIYLWMNWNTAIYRDEPKVLMELVIEYTDGTSETIITDESWKTYTHGSVTCNNIYLGETQDARLAVDGWANASFDDAAWEAAVLVDAPAGNLVFENMEPMRRLKTFTPTVINKGSGTFILENPVMTTGWAKIAFHAPAGTEIVIRYGEKLDEQGFVITPTYGYNMQIDTYICCGEPGEVYEPKFSYKGYRYIQIENYPGELTADDVECYLIANDIASVSTFETGDARINLLNEMMVRTMLNNVQGKITDTPVYEKNGWTATLILHLNPIISTLIFR